MSEYYLLNKMLILGRSVFWSSTSQQPQRSRHRLLNLKALIQSHHIRVSMDFSHHINAKSKARHPSPLKDIIKYMEHEGMISLAGGECQT